MAVRAASSSSAKGNTAPGLIWRLVPVPTTTGVVQNGHSAAWVAPSNTTSPHNWGNATRAPLAWHGRAVDRPSRFQRVFPQPQPQCPPAPKAPRWPMAVGCRKTRIAAPPRRDQSGNRPRIARSQTGVRPLGACYGASPMGGGGGGITVKSCASSATSPACIQPSWPAVQT